MTEVKLYKSPWRALLVFVYTLPFVVLGAWMISDEDISGIEYIVAWLCVCFFGLGIPVGLFHLLDWRPQIIINERGIFDRTTHKEFINWDIIEDAYLFDVEGQKFICLKVDKRFKPSRKKGKVYKSVARLSEAMGAQELNVNLGQIRIDEVKLTAFIKAMSRADVEEKTELIKRLPQIL